MSARFDTLGQSIQEQLLQWGLGSFWSGLLLQALVVVVLVLLAVCANVIAKRGLLFAVQAVIRKSRFRWDDYLLERGVFERLSHIAPALVFYLGAHLIFPDDVLLQSLLQRLVVVYIIIVALMVLDALLNTVVDIYQTLPVSRDRPIRSYIQVFKIVVYVVAAVVALGVLMNRSPVVFLSGIGAMTAVILLVFKDSILGLVASIQLSAQNMVRIGDWIEMPKYGADGDVVEITLTTVKVQNWDKTITTIPTYALVSESFKNWRGMTLSGGRRIKRAVKIDINSVRFCDEELLTRFSKFRLLRAYLNERVSEIKAANEELEEADRVVVANGRRLTNIGTFRRYLVEYLKEHPKIHNGMTLLVRQLEPGAEGLPIELYCFSNDQAWVAYEDLQSDIFDHILAVLPEFELRVFQNPSGTDFRTLFRGSPVT